MFFLSPVVENTTHTNTPLVNFSYQKNQENQKVELRETVEQLNKGNSIFSSVVAFSPLKVSQNKYTYMYRAQQHHQQQQQSLSKLSLNYAPHFYGTLLLLPSRFLCLYLLYFTTLLVLLLLLLLYLPACLLPFFAIYIHPSIFLFHRQIETTTAASSTNTNIRSSSHNRLLLVTSTRTTIKMKYTRGRNRKIQMEMSLCLPYCRDSSNDI